MDGLILICVRFDKYQIAFGQKLAVGLNGLLQEPARIVAQVQDYAPVGLSLRNLAESGFQFPVHTGGKLRDLDV